MTQGYDDVTELVDSIAKQLVNNPDAASASGTLLDNGDYLIEITVDEDDIGKIIGRQGRIIKSIRTLARAAASQCDFQAEVELAE